MWNKIFLFFTALELQYKKHPWAQLCTHYDRHLLTPHLAGITACKHFRFWSHKQCLHSYLVIHKILLLSPKRLNSVRNPGGLGFTAVWIYRLINLYVMDFEASHPEPFIGDCFRNGFVFNWIHSFLIRLQHNPKSRVTPMLRCSKNQIQHLLLSKNIFAHCTQKVLF